MDTKSSSPNSKIFRPWASLPAHSPTSTRQAANCEDRLTPEFRPSEVNWTYDPLDSYYYGPCADLGLLPLHPLPPLPPLPPSPLSPPSSKQRPKKFPCPHCNVSFSNNGQLRGHVRIHTGERPFKCEHEGCGKSFTRNEELTRHKRIHTGVRPYPCDWCGKTFGRKDHLKKHVRTHLPQPPVPLHLPPFILYPYPY